MNVVDSSAWLSYLANDRNAGYFSGAIEKTEELLIPALCLYEVFKRVIQQRDEGDALQAIAMMQQGVVVPLDEILSVTAARLSLEHKLPMADSLILATARAFGATLWTQDSDFAGLPDVKYRKRA